MRSILALVLLLGACEAESSGASNVTGEEQHGPLATVEPALGDYIAEWTCLEEFECDAPFEAYPGWIVFLRDDGMAVLQRDTDYQVRALVDPASWHSETGLLFPGERTGPFTLVAGAGAMESVLIWKNTFEVNERWGVRFLPGVHEGDPVPQL